MGFTDTSIANAAGERPDWATMRELARARRIAEALTSAGDRAIVEAYIRELSARPTVLADSETAAQ